MFTCGTCWKTFASGWWARDQHCQATGHEAPEFECDTCDEYFEDDADRWEHMKNRNHFQLECRICDEIWTSEDSRKKHEANVHFYCADCDRTFGNANAVKMHLNSEKHRGRNIKCPFCKDNFVSATGLTHHLEKGSCPKAPQLNHDIIYRIIRAKDPGGLITKNLIGGAESSQYRATARAYNDDTGRYDCYLCTRNFGSLTSLNQHLTSRAHQQALYHCPNRRCGQNFMTMGALINHLESESCDFIRYEALQRQMEGLISSDRRLEF